MSAPTVLTNKFAQANSNGTTPATIFTHITALKNPDGSAGYGGILDRIVIYNADTVSHTIAIHRVPAAGTASSATVIARVTLAAFNYFILEGPFYSTDSAFYQVALGEGITTNQASCQAYYHEMS